MRLQTMVWKEGKTYIIKEVITGVTTQGKTIEEAMKNIKEAVSLYLDEMPGIKSELKHMNAIGAVSVEIS
ncbi:MAG: type II toxin-antitoxin system HicB family antitoxin [Candidatus Micrarchaeota archaeon]|nr:type II toxin-antitoxin system HicB family antitoxin [Candidatus Micrarchaeota archaeon]